MLTGCSLACHLPADALTTPYVLIDFACLCRVSLVDDEFIERCVSELAVGKAKHLFERVICLFNCEVRFLEGSDNKRNGNGIKKIRKSISFLLEPSLTLPEIGDFFVYCDEPNDLVVSICDW